MWSCAPKKICCYRRILRSHLVVGLYDTISVNKDFIFFCHVNRGLEKSCVLLLQNVSLPWPLQNRHVSKFLNAHIKTTECGFLPQKFLCSVTGHVDIY